MSKISVITKQSTPAMALSSRRKADALQNQLVESDSKQTQMDNDTAKNMNGGNDETAQIIAELGSVAADLKAATSAIEECNTPDASGEGVKKSVNQGNPDDVTVDDLKRFRKIAGTGKPKPLIKAAVNGTGRPPLWAPKQSLQNLPKNPVPPTVSRTKVIGSHIKLTENLASKSGVPPKSVAATPAVTPPAEIEPVVLPATSHQPNAVSASVPVTEPETEVVTPEERKVQRLVLLKLRQALSSLPTKPTFEQKSTSAENDHDPNTRQVSSNGSVKNGVSHRTTNRSADKSNSGNMKSTFVKQSTNVNKAETAKDEKTRRPLPHVKDSKNVPPRKPFLTTSYTVKVPTTHCVTRISQHGNVARIGTVAQRNVCKKKGKQNKAKRKRAVTEPGREYNNPFALFPVLSQDYFHPVFKFSDETIATYLGPNFYSIGEAPMYFRGSPKMESNSSANKNRPNSAKRCVKAQTVDDLVYRVYYPDVLHRKDGTRKQLQVSRLVPHHVARLKRPPTYFYRNSPFDSEIQCSIRPSTVRSAELLDPNRSYQIQRPSFSSDMMNESGEDVSPPPSTPREAKANQRRPIHFRKIVRTISAPNLSSYTSILTREEISLLRVRWAGQTHSERCLIKPDPVQKASKIPKMLGVSSSTTKATSAEIVLICPKTDAELETGLTVRDLF